MQEQSLFQKIFIFVAAIAICVLLVLDTVALVEKFGGEEVKAIVGSVGAPPAGADAGTTTGTNDLPKLEEIFTPKKDDTQPVKETDTFSFGQYYHELGEYGFGNTLTVPSIVFAQDGTFVFSENTGSGMGTCSGTYALSSDGATLTCSVAAADIACPDVILFTVSTDGAIVLNTDLKKSITGDSFIIRLPDAE